MENRFLKNKKAIVTGASRGIGAETARVLGKYGADIVIGFFDDKENADNVVNDISTSYGVRIKAIEADLANITTLRRFIQDGVQFLDGVDILINNAGVDDMHPALELPVEQWDKIMAVNLRAPFFCAQEVGKVMKQQFNQNPDRESVIINISSIHDDVPRMGLLHYCSAKAGLKMMTRTLGLEFAEFNTRVIALSPGAIETDMNRDAIDNVLGRARFEGWVPMKRIGNTHEVAETVAFLASSAASYITSTTIYIDGGYSQNILKYDDRTLGE